MDRFHIFAIVFEVANIFAGTQVKTPAAVTN
jgi:hypothetical protein